MRDFPIIQCGSNGKIFVVCYEKESLNQKLHTHAELQITHIKKGSGSVVIGDYLGQFSSGDIFVIGSHVPHVFRPSVSQTESQECNALILTHIYISENLTQNNMFESLELNDIFVKAKKGMRLNNSKKDAIGLKAIELTKQTGLNEVITILSILNQLSNSFDMEFLNGKNSEIYGGKTVGRRLNDVVNFTLNNYNKKITINDVANIANMVPVAFCRFFRQRTGKTYIDYLNEIRILNACKLLIAKDRPISEISTKSGYNNVAYFNRTFKNTTGHTPSEYKKKVEC